MQILGLLEFLMIAIQLLIGAHFEYFIDKSVFSFSVCSNKVKSR